MTRKSRPLTTPSWARAVSTRRRLYTIFAIILTVLFAALVYYPFSLRYAAPVEYVQAVYASQSIHMAELITEDLLELRNVPINALPGLYFQYREQVVGRSALIEMVPGELVLPNKLMGDQGGLLAQKCSPAQWCINVPSDWFIVPPPNLSDTDRIEIAIYQSGTPPEEAGIIVTDAKVIGIISNPNSFILSVDVQEALSLLYAHVNEYSMYVLLRPIGG